MNFTPPVSNEPAATRCAPRPINKGVTIDDLRRARSMYFRDVRRSQLKSAHNAREKRVAALRASRARSMPFPDVHDLPVFANREKMVPNREAINALYAAETERLCINA